MALDPGLEIAASIMERGYRLSAPEFAKEYLDLHLYSKQREIAESVRVNRRTAVPSCHGAGKAVGLETPLPTPVGWTTMGQVSAGDWLLDEEGQPCQVLQESPVHLRPSFEVRFSDGTSILASDDHLWQVSDLAVRHHIRASRASRGLPAPTDWRKYWDQTVGLTTAEIAGSLRLGGQLRWGVPTARPIRGAARDLPLDPYALGIWLGDGTAKDGSLTLNIHDDVWIRPQIVEGGLEPRERPSGRRSGSVLLGVPTLRTTLKATGLFGDKHIPAVYLRADPDSRLALLQGLMDSDGTITENGRITFEVTNARLADSVAELVASLGWPCYRATRPAVLNGRVLGSRYSIRFVADRPVFRLPRKLERQRLAGSQRSRWTLRTITAVTPVGIRPVKCVAVDSPRHLYLAGSGFIPTHNSLNASVLALHWIWSHPPGDAFVISTAPTHDQVKGVLWREINKHHRRGKLPGRLNQTEWWLDDQLVAMGRKPSDYNVSAFQGIHARHVLVLLDEACGIPKELWLAAGSLADNDSSRILAIGNPDDPGSYFREICRPGSGWHTIPISYKDTPHFSGEKVPAELLKEGIIGPTYVEEMRQDVGENGAAFISRCLGQFPDDADDGVVSLSALRRCQRSEQHPTGDQLLPIELGWDVGAGGDRSVVRERRGVTAGRTWYPKGADTMSQVGEVVQAIDESQAVRIKVDSIGVGWGAADRLAELMRERKDSGRHHCQVVRVLVSERATQPAKYLRLRDQIWWEIGHQLIRDGGVDLRQLDESCVAQLVAPKYSLDSSGRIVIEPKKDTRDRLGRSPDDADALLLAYYSAHNQGLAFMEAWRRQTTKTGDSAAITTDAPVDSAVVKSIVLRRRPQPARTRSPRCDHRWSWSGERCVFCGESKEKVLNDV